MSYPSTLTDFYVPQLLVYDKKKISQHLLKVKLSAINKNILYFLIFKIPLMNLQVVLEIINLMYPYNVQILLFLLYYILTFFIQHEISHDNTTNSVKD